MIAMNRNALMLILLAVAFPSPCRAQSWGWPPANYTAGGVRHSDCAQFRGICDVLRERGWGMRLRRNCHGCSAYPSFPVHSGPTEVLGGCGCGPSMARQGLPLAENQEPPLLAEKANEPSGPVLLAPEEMDAVELDAPVEAPLFSMPNLDRRTN